MPIEYKSRILLLSSQFKIFFLFLLLAICTYGQTGPGGVGTANGSGTLGLCLKTNVGVNGSITSWSDQSGYGNHGTPTNSPTVTSNSLNNYDIITFDGADDDFKISNNAQLNFGSGAFSITLVYRITSLNTRMVLLDKRESGNNDGWLLMTGNSDQSRVSFIRGRTFGGENTSNTGAVIQNQWQVLQLVSNGTTLNFYINGSSVGSTTICGSNLAATTATLSVGEKNYSGSSARNLAGNIAEIIIRKKATTNIERIIEENYLGNKYNITTSNDQFAYSTTHQFDIAGIGRATRIDRCPFSGQ